MLNPKDLIWASPSSRPICHSPCGAQLGVSIPNQATALITYGRPSAVMMVAPSVCSQPEPPDAVFLAPTPTQVPDSRISPHPQAFFRSPRYAFMSTVSRPVPATTTREPATRDE